MATAFATTGSRAATGSVILLLLSVPIIQSLVDNEFLKSALLVVVTILLGCGLGWVIGDAFLSSGIVGKLVAACLVLIVAGQGLFHPAWTLARGVETPDAKTFFYNFFAEPLERPSFEGGIR